MFTYTSWVVSALWGLVMHFVMWKDKSIASKCIGVVLSFVGGIVIGAVGETLDEEYEVEIKARKKKDSSGVDEPTVNQEAEEYSRNYVNDLNALKMPLQNLKNAMKKANSTPGLPDGDFPF